MAAGVGEEESETGHWGRPVGAGAAEVGFNEEGEVAKGYLGQRALNWAFWASIKFGRRPNFRFFYFFITIS